MIDHVNTALEVIIGHYFGDNYVRVGAKKTYGLVDLNLYNYQNNSNFSATTLMTM